MGRGRSSVGPLEEAGPRRGPEVRAVGRAGAWAPGGRGRGAYTLGSRGGKGTDAREGANRGLRRPRGLLGNVVWRLPRRRAWGLSRAGGRE